MKDKHLQAAQKMQQKLNDIDFDFDKEARQTGFMQRVPKKIFPEHLCKALCLLTFHTKITFNSWAILLGLNINNIISCQAINKRVNSKFAALMKNALAAVIQKHTHSQQLQAQGVFSKFKRVLVEDSTVIKVSSKLFSYFPGGGNHINKKSASIRIQAAFDIIGQKFINFRLSPYTRNDQAAAPDILKLLKEGDVLIRDLGYFALHALKKIAEMKNTYFLSKHRFKTGLYSTTKENLNLLNIIEKGKILDIPILLGQKEQIQSRLVAIPVPQEIANTRRMKLKNKRDKRCKPSKKQLALLDWEIFVTNVPKTVWEAKNIGEIYGLRWRIEIIFKTWKSHFKMANVPICNSRHYVEAIIYARLIVIILFYAVFATIHLQKGKKNKHQQISLLKFSNFVSANFWLLFAFDHNYGYNELFEKFILKFCMYDKRKRENYEQVFQALSS